MSLFYQPKQIRKFRNTVVALGTFDGVHRGHQWLLGTALKKAAELNGTCLALTFDHIPREVLKKNVFGVLLTPLAEKIQLIKGLGVKHVLVLKFTRQLAAWPPRKFVEEILVNKLAVKLLVVGENYRFGAGQAGGIEQLRTLGKALGFQVLVIPTRQIDGHKISSTRIREMLKAGKIGQAGRLLGRQFSFSGTVVKGGHLGASIGFPTANLVPDRRMLLPEGVFAARVLVAAKKYRAVVNVGFRPSVTGESPRKLVVEAFIFAFHRMIYGRRIRIEMVKKIRAERFFADRRKLAAQIAKDAARARVILDRT